MFGVSVVQVLRTVLLCFVLFWCFVVVDIYVACGLCWFDSVDCVDFCLYMLVIAYFCLGLVLLVVGGWLLC